jgi:hypothetical protein
MDANKSIELLSIQYIYKMEQQIKIKIIFEDETRINLLCLSYLKAC